MFDFFFSSGSVLRDLHSFPTRRSSDLFVAVLLGFLVSTASHLSTDIEKLIGSSSDLTEKIVAETDAIEPLIGNKTFPDRKSTRLNSSHEWISYAVFCLKKKNNQDLAFD